MVAKKKTQTKATAKKATAKKEAVVKEEVVAKEPEVKEEVLVTEDDLISKQAEIDAEKADLDKQLKEMRLQRNRKTIEAVSCVNCGTILNIDPEVFMEQGLSVKDFTCQKCDHVTRVTISFPADPSESDPMIKTQDRGLVYMLKPIGELTPDEIKKRVIVEAEAVENDTAKLDPRVKLLLVAVKQLLK